jgi:hypothetical protein
VRFSLSAIEALRRAGRSWISLRARDEGHGPKRSTKGSGIICSVSYRHIRDICVSTIFPAISFGVLRGCVDVKLSFRPAGTAAEEGKEGLNDDDERTICVFVSGPAEARVGEVSEV